MRSEGLLKALWRFAFRVAGRLVPLPVMRMLAFPLGGLLALLGVRQAVAERNLHLAFPEMSDQQAKRLAHAALCSLTTVYLEIPTLRYLSRTRLRQVLEIENLSLLSSINERGALLLSGHVGNWELLALGAGLQSERSFAVVVKGQKDFGELERTRRAFGNTTIPLHRSALRSSRILAAGGIVAMLADQSARREDHVVELFGIPTHAYSAPARLALRYRPKVIVGFAVRIPGGNYRAPLRELPYDDLADDEAGVHAFTTRYMAMLEEIVRAHPEQWVWQHRRWKHTPGMAYGRQERAGGEKE